MTTGRFIFSTGMNILCRSVVASSPGSMPSEFMEASAEVRRERLGSRLGRLSFV